MMMLSDIRVALDDDDMILHFCDTENITYPSLRIKGISSTGILIVSTSTKSKHQSLHAFSRDSHFHVTGRLDKWYRGKG